MSTTSPRLLTAEEFLLLPDPDDGTRQELVRGMVVSTPLPGFLHGHVRAHLASLLNQHASARRCGRVVLGTGVITERDPDTVRGPDVSYWSAERLPLDQHPEGYPEPAPDLCVEILSPSSRPGQVRGKVREYFAHGVRMVWIVDPEDRSVLVYRSPDEARLLHETATLAGDDVLPGFTCRVVDLFA